MPERSYPAFRDDRGIYPLGELTERCSIDYGHLTALQWWNGHGYGGYTYHELHEKVVSLARWLIWQGIRPEDRVAIYAENSPQWGIAYLAIQRAGAIGVPIDRALPAPGAANILEHADVRLIFSQCSFLEALDSVAHKPEMTATVSMDPCGILGVVAFEDALSEGAARSDEFPTRELGDLAVILYTSGTTGHSKGVMLTQHNIMSNVAASSQLTDLGPGDGILVLLPLHHSLQCTNGFLHPLYLGMTLTFARRLRSAEILADIRDAKITLMGSVPLMFEKMHQRMLQELRKRSIPIRLLFRVLMAFSALGETLHVNLGRFLFRAVRRKGGLGSIRYFITGGAAIDPKTSKFFTRLGIPVMQGYGLTETSPVTHFTPPTRIRHGCVGLPVPGGVRAKIAHPGEDGVGEVCIKGPNVFLGYYKNEEATEAVFDDDGWFHTGDLGIIHGNGYLQITGRMKNVIVTGGGKNVYPEEVEHHLNRCPYVLETLVLGIRRDGAPGEDVGALLQPDTEALTEKFGEDEVPDGKDLLRFLRDELRHTQKDLPVYSRVRTYGLMKEEFEKTTTLKIKRFLYSGRFHDSAAVVL